MKNFIKIIAIIICLIISNNCSSQMLFNPLTDCPDISEEMSPLPVGGIYKPHRTDMNGNDPSPAAARLNVLIVFVQFSNESIQSSEWQIDSTPVFMSDLVAEVKDTIGDYWDRYNENTEILSDWYQEVSKGLMHVTGKAYNIILDSTDTYYNNQGVAVMNNEIYQKLENLGTINWHDYDLWRKHDHPDSMYYYQPDGYIDMIYKIHRHKGNTNNLFDGSGGFAYLKGDLYRITVGPYDTLKIDPNYGTKGSGLTIFGTVQGVVNKLFTFNVARHEYGHYLLGPHTNVGIMGIAEAFLSPLEMIKLGYMSPRVVNYDTTSYGLFDFSSRNTNSQILQVPIQGSTEYFLLTNRSKVSRYDVIMYGDSAKGDPFRDVGKLGKGIYIYHIAGSYTMDEECADGLFNWTKTGYDAPDWDPTNYWLPVIKPTSVSYSNEVTVVCSPYCSVNLSNTDDRNVLSTNNVNGVTGKWFSIGAKHDTDKIFTNQDTNWTSRSMFGDRYDAWNVGYNEIFSPYSSPSTKTWNNSNSGVYIWHYQNSGSGPSGLAYFKIYKAGEGGYTDSSILAITPPSRPMGLRVLPCDSLPQVGDYKRIKISWNHNQEPDMIRTNYADTIPVNFKRYKIYRSMTESMSEVPPDALAFSENHYVFIAEKDIPTNALPEFTDTLISICNSTNSTQTWYPFPVRYRVQAIDKYEDASVLSDFANTQAWRIVSQTVGYEEEGRPALSEDLTIPNDFDLKQNYPNPFNPSTNIQYDLPFDNLVSIKIYNVLGKEVATLVNEIKTAGRYIVSFNASNYASGIYYYKIKAGNFEQVRKMIILK